MEFTGFFIVFAVAFAIGWFARDTKARNDAAKIRPCPEDDTDTSA